MPSIHLDRLNTTQNQIKKIAKIKTVINNKQFSIVNINLRTAKEELKLAVYVMHVIFRTGLASGCRRNAEIGIGLVWLFKAFSKRWFL